MTGFEPATPCTPCKYATRLRYIPKSHAKIRIGALFSKWNALLIPVFYQQPTVQETPVRNFNNIPITSGRNCAGIEFSVPFKSSAGYFWEDHFSVSVVHFYVRIRVILHPVYFPRIIDAVSIWRETVRNVKNREVHLSDHAVSRSFYIDSMVSVRKIAEDVRRLPNWII